MHFTTTHPLVLALILISQCPSVVPLLSPQPSLHYSTSTIKDKVLLYSSQSPNQQQQNDSSVPRQLSNNVRSEILSYRTIASLNKYSRLPVWPAWNGAFLFLLSLVLPPQTIAKLEDKFGGRVCPIIFPDPMATSPFILLVHHVHSFTSFDPLRLFQKNFILPEGFPSHPHRGFITLTYCLKGGMLHRDSLGIKQRYGAESRHKGKFAQWLVAGAGILHEEMWDLGQDLVSEQELFQLWVNLPNSYKMTKPTIRLLSDGGEDEDEGENLSHTPIVHSECGRVKTVVLVGEYDGTQSDIDTASSMSILHVSMKSTTSSSSTPCIWTMDLPQSFQTAMIYMRAGSANLLSGIDGSIRDEIPTHHTAMLSSSGGTLCMEGHGNDGADFLLLAGEPIREMVVSQGSMVMSNPADIEAAYSDYQRGLMGRPWDHQLTDDEWNEHIEQNPSSYK